MSMEDHVSISRSPLQRYEQQHEQQQQQQLLQQQLSGCSSTKMHHRASTRKPSSSAAFRSHSEKGLYRSSSDCGGLQQPKSPSKAAADEMSITVRMGSSPRSEDVPPFHATAAASRTQVSPQPNSEILLLDTSLNSSSHSSSISSLQLPLLGYASGSGLISSPSSRGSGAAALSALSCHQASGDSSSLRGTLLTCSRWIFGGNNGSGSNNGGGSSSSARPLVGAFAAEASCSSMSRLRDASAAAAEASRQPVHRLNSNSLPSHVLGASSRRFVHAQGSEKLSSLSLLASLPQRARRFAVVEITEGVCHRLHLQTPELLRMVHLHNKNKELLDTRVGALKLRDLRQVVSPSGDSRPSIEVRRNCVLVNMPSIRCIILYQRVFILPANTINTGRTALQGMGFKSARCSQLSENTAAQEDEGAGAEETLEQQNEMLISKLVHLSELKRSGPAEFAALEALLVHVCDSLIAEVSPLKAAADRVLQYFHEQPSSTRRLRQISELKRQLGSSKERAHGISRAIRELLNEEEDMLRLEVSKFWGRDDLWDAPPKTAEAEDAEILLECYEQEVEAISQVISRTEDALDDALQLMELHLASTRNAFLKTEIALDILSAFFGFIAAVAGVFGMNIKNGLEDSVVVFWVALTTAAVACAAVLGAVYTWFKRQKL